jgi:hypothetical protein
LDRIVGSGKTANQWRKELEEKRAQGVIFRDVEGSQPDPLSLRGYAVDRWQPGADSKWSGQEEPVEQFPKELPKGAIGWDDDGNPHYGGRTPFQEWQLRAHANLERTEQITPEQASWGDWDAPRIGDQEGFVNKAKAVLAGAVEGYDQISESVDYALSGGDEDVNDLQRGWRQASHYAAETLQRLGSVAYQTKLFFGGVAHLAEEKFQIGAGVGDEEIHFSERNEQLARDSDQFTVAPKHDTKFWRSLGISADFIDEYKQGALAGRMFYTSIWDNAVDSTRDITGTGKAGNMKKEEFLRYMRDNPQANPNVAVKKYENPAAEMWGEIIFDPLNVVEWGAKLTTAAILTGRAARYFATPMGEVAKVLSKGGANRVSGVLDDAQSAIKLDTVINARLVDVAKVEDGVSDFAKSKAVWQLTNNAKAHVMAQDMTAVNQWIWRMSKTADGYSIDTMQDIQRLVVKSASNNKEEVAEALQGLSRFPGYDIVFTEPGTRSALFMKDLWTPGKMDKIRDALTKHPEDFQKGLREAVELSDEMINSQTKKFFPDMQTEAYNAKGGWKLLAKTHRYMQDGPYKFFNKVFSSVYMGLNPGFAARNVMQNTLQGLLDEGIHGVFGIGARRNVTKWAGGVAPPGFSTEFGSITKGEEVRLTSKVFVGTNVAAAGERKAGEMLFNKIYPKTMKKLLRKGLGWKELQKHGIDKEDARYLIASIMDSGGDYNKAVDKLVEAHKTGFIDLQNTTLHWTDEMSDWADELSMREDIMDIMLNSKTREEAVLGIRQSFQKLWDEGNRVVDDYPTIEAGAMGAREVQVRAEAIDKAGSRMLKEDQYFVTTYHGMNHKVTLAANEMATNYKTDLASQLIRDGHFADTKEANAFLMRQLDGVTLEGTPVPLADYLKGESSRQYQFIENEQAYILAAISNDKDVVLRQNANLEELWNDWGVPKFAGEYKGQNKWEVREQMWIGQRKISRPMYERFRDEVALANQRSAEIWKAAADNLRPGIKEYAPADPAKLRNTLAKAKKFDSFMDRRDIQQQLGAAIEADDAERIAIQFARMFNLPTMSEAGVPKDQMIVNIINKQLGKRFTSLKQMKGRIDGRDIEKALLAHATGETIGVYSTAGRDGWIALRKFVSTGNLTDIEKAEVSRTIDVVRQVDRELADALESTIANRNGMLADKARRGRRMTEATTAQLDEEIAVVQQNMDELIDEAQQALNDIDIDEVNVQTLAEELVDERITEIRNSRKVTDPDMTYYSGEGPPGSGRQAYELRPKIRDMEEKFVDMARNSWGKTAPVERTQAAIDNLEGVRKYAGRVVEESRQISGRVALNKRNFILHDYNKKRNFDLALSYVMPYHFWYNRTYAAWLQRTVTHPGTITAYLDYKDALQKMHADMPDWWKNNISSNELLGIDSDSPFYFNFEQTLNPLNGLTGIDFDDRDKAFSWFSSFMQDVGKFGPSIYTPFAWAIAADAHRRGETEAVAKWAGRAIPQTQAFKALTAKMGYGPGGSGIELDPAIWLTAGGMDVWESRRVGRALGWAVDQGILSEEAAQQAAMEGPGNEDFDNARGAAQDKRSDGQLSSFMFGTGFKGRTQEDLEIDRMDEEYHRFMQMKESMDPDQIAESYDYFKEKYPFFSTLMIARRDVDGRDSSYAYSVLSRIPPGQTKEAYRSMGLDREQVQEFWDAKTIPEHWKESERLKFNEAIQTMGTILALPQDATKQEWDEVRKINKSLYETAEKRFGAQTVEDADTFWELYGDDPQLAKAFKEANPQVQAYQDFLTWGKQNDPLLRKYYASYDNLRHLIQGSTWDVLDEKYPEYREINAQYQELRLTDARKAKAFKKANPILSEYQDEKKRLKAANAERLIQFATYLPSRTPEPVFREDIPAPEQQSEEQQAIVEGFGQEELPEYYDYSWSDWQGRMTPALGRLVEDWIVGASDDLSYTARQSLDYQLKDLDLDDEFLLRLMRNSYFGTYALPE